jgi:hypothetical protein
VVIFVPVVDELEAELKTLWSGEAEQEPATTPERTSAETTTRAERRDRARLDDTATS